jgi:hypothetical protein
MSIKISCFQLNEKINSILKGILRIKASLLTAANPVVERGEDLSKLIPCKLEQKKAA